LGNRRKHTLAQCLFETMVQRRPNNVGPTYITQPIANCLGYACCSSSLSNAARNFVSRPCLDVCNVGHVAVYGMCAAITILGPKHQRALACSLGHGFSQACVRGGNQTGKHQLPLEIWRRPQFLESHTLLQCKKRFEPDAVPGSQISQSCLCCCGYAPDLK